MLDQGVPDPPEPRCCCALARPCRRRSPGAIGDTLPCGQGDGCASIGRRHEQHHGFTDLLEKAENVAGVTADLPLRKHPGERDRGRRREQSQGSRRRSQVVSAMTAPISAAAVATARLGRPAATPRPRRGPPQQMHRGRHFRATQRGPRQRKPGENRLADRRDRGRAQTDAEHEGDDAIGSVRASRMIASLYPDSAAEPVGRSASPSSCSAPVAAIPAATASSAASPTGKPISPASEERAAHSAPMPPPISGNAQPAAAIAPGHGRLRRERKPGQYTGGDREFVERAAPRIHVAEK